MLGREQTARNGTARLACVKKDSEVRAASVRRIFFVPMFNAHHTCPYGLVDRSVSVFVCLARLHDLDPIQRL